MTSCNKHALDHALDRNLPTRVNNINMKGKKQVIKRTFVEFNVASINLSFMIEEKYYFTHGCVQYTKSGNTDVC